MQKDRIYKNIKCSKNLYSFIHIKIDEEPITADLARRCDTTKLQIVVLCAALCALPEHFLQSQLSVCLRPDIVLGILLEVPEERIAAIQRQALPSYRRWRRCVVPQQTHSCGTSGSGLSSNNPQQQQALYDQQSLIMAKVLGIATDILGRALCQRPLCNATSVSSTSSASSEKWLQHGTSSHGSALLSPAGFDGSNHHNHSNSNEAHFTVLPRKVKVGQSKVVALLSEPLSRDDVVRVLIEKSGGGGGELLPVAGLKRRNPYTLQFTVPDSCMEVSTMIDIRIVRNDRELGRRPVKCESRLRELEQLLRAQDSPLEFMCQAMGVLVADQTALDTHLVQAFQRNMPVGFHLLTGAAASATAATAATPPTCVKSAILAATGGSKADTSHKTEEFPTLLHFAARWGFEQLAVQLMECPGAEVACEQRNVAGRTPADMAECAGHIKLASSLKSFTVNIFGLIIVCTLRHVLIVELFKKSVQQMNELSTMYHYFKGISSNSTTITNNIDKEAIDANNEESNDTDQLTAIRKPSSSVSTIRSEEYMEMNPDLSTEHSNAVTNLNYINIDSIKDEEIARNLDDETTMMDRDAATAENKAAFIDTVDGAQGVLCSELRIQEPAYYDSQEINQKQPISVQSPAVELASPVTVASLQADAFSQDCLNVLENCSGSRTGSSMSSGSSVSAASTKLITSASKSFATPPPPPPCRKLSSKSSSPSTPLALSPIPSPTNENTGDYMMHPSNIPVQLPPGKPTSSAAVDVGDYVMQPSNRPVCPTPQLEATTTVAASAATSTANATPSSTPNIVGILQRQESNVSKASSTGTTPATAAPSSVDEELLEIMNDFKNNVFTIQEVEQLVDAWRARNDVRQSYQDKQEQLARMRTEYERVQATVREKMKHRPTPFERMRKLFTRSKSSSSSSSTVNNQQQSLKSGRSASTEDGDRLATASVVGLDDCGETSPQVNAAAVSKNGIRPRSSLSLQSLSSSTSSSSTTTCSSSGRLSTGSACSGTSLGDSGTHSDPEEQRRNANCNNNGGNAVVGGVCRIGTPGSLLMGQNNCMASDNYLVPPTPRPVSTQSLQTPTSPDASSPKGSYFVASGSNSRCNGQPPQKPTTLNLNSVEFSENYVMFPSNVPVFASPTSPLSSGGSSTPTSCGSSLGHHHEYMNFSGLNTIDETKETTTVGNGSNVMAIKIRTPEEIYGICGSSNSVSGGPLHNHNGNATMAPSTSSCSTSTKRLPFAASDLCSSFKPPQQQQTTTASTAMFSVSMPVTPATSNVGNNWPVHWTVWIAGRTRVWLS